jgi:hypothetical protein
LSTPASRARTVAISYAILSALYLAIIGLLASALWLDSWQRLWNDMSGRLLLALGGAAAVNALMAALAFWFTKLPRAGRALTLLISLILTGLAANDLFAAIMHRHQTEVPMPPWTLVTARSLLALGYALCAVSLWRIGRVASNNRWRGP